MNNRLYHYYRVLGLDSSHIHTVQDIEKAFRKKARQFHPDKNQDNPRATKQMQLITSAYETLKHLHERPRSNHQLSCTYTYYDQIETIINQLHSQGKEEDLFYQRPVFIDSLVKILRIAEARSNSDFYQGSEELSERVAIATIELIIQLLFTPNESHPLAMFHYGKKILKIYQDEDKEGSFGAFLNQITLVNTLLDESLGLQLQSLDLFELDFEIKRARQTLSNNDEHNQFISLLENLRQKIDEDLSNKEKSLPKHLASDSSKIAKMTINTLQKIEYLEETKTTDEKHFKEYSQNLKNFNQQSAVVKAALFIVKISLNFIFGKTKGKQLTTKVKNSVNHLLFKPSISTACKLKHEGYQSLKVRH